MGIPLLLMAVIGGVALSMSSSVGADYKKKKKAYDKAFAKWNANPYAVSGGGDGRAHTVPMPYLIGYWLMRYYGVIQVP